MATISVQLRSIPDTEAALGWAGSHTVVVDRPDGKAGGKGLGFSGGELLGLAIGGCFCNDLQYVAHDMRVRLDSVRVEVTVVLEGNPLVATSATMQVKIETKNPTVSVDDLIKRAHEISTVANSLQRGSRSNYLSGPPCGGALDLYKQKPRRHRVRQGSVGSAARWGRGR